MESRHAFKEFNSIKRSRLVGQRLRKCVDQVITGATWERKQLSLQIRTSRRASQHDHLPVSKFCHVPQETSFLVSFRLNRNDVKAPLLQSTDQWCAQTGVFDQNRIRLLLMRPRQHPLLQILVFPLARHSACNKIFIALDKDIQACRSCIRFTGLLGRIPSLQVY